MPALLALFLPKFIDMLLGPGLDLIKQYQAGQITKEQLRDNLMAQAMQHWADVERANADMVVKTYGAFTQLVMSSRVVQFAYVFVVVTQGAVLCWAQVGIPWLVWKYGGSFPSGGVTLDWGYALLVLLCGGGMAAMRRPAQPGPK